MSLTGLNKAFNEGDYNKILLELKLLCQQTNVTFIANKSGVGRESLYKTLNGKCDPRFSTIIKIMKSLDLKVTVEQLEISKNNILNFKIEQAKKRCMNAEKFLKSLTKEQE